jgi:hypothetical protein
MSRYQPYSRRALRAMFKTWVRQNRRLLALMAAGVVVLLAFETAVIALLWNLPGRGYVLGLTHAAIVAAFIQIVGTTFLANKREAIWHLRGAWGEENTRDELKRAKRKRLIWGSIDSVNLGTGDIDHLVVTRSGGLVVLDSKWRTVAVTDPADLARSASKVKLRAEGVARSILRSGRGSHRAPGHSVTVLSAVVLWGPAQHDIPPNAESAGIPFVGGKRLVAWLRDLQGQPIEKSAAQDLLRQLEEFRASAWSQPTPTFHS